MNMNDPLIDQCIRSALRDADREGKLDIVAAVTGFPGGEEELRKIMNSTVELSRTARALLGMGLE